ncbi:MAG: hypothetical protein KJ767_01335 [Nanoarchaeota archaeon]|nr:hypothetical protein [Nanoarchaeota archaeon]
MTKITKILEDGNELELKLNNTNYLCLTDNSEKNPIYYAFPVLPDHILPDKFEKAKQLFEKINSKKDFERFLYS